MLLKFRFSNFRSFRAEQELSLIASKLAGPDDGLFSPPGLGEQVLPVAAIYGANASGKTAVVRAIGFMADAVKWSHTQWLPDAPIPVEPFVAEAKEVPSEFVTDFLLAGSRHQYGFAANAEAILHEWLYVYPKGKRQVWFERVAGDPISFGAKMPGENRTIEALVRKNSLFLSAAAQNNHEALTPVHNWFSQVLSPVTPQDWRFAGRFRLHGAELAQLCTDKTVKAMLAQLLSNADLGICDLVVEDAMLPEVTRSLLEALRPSLRPMAGTLALPETVPTVRLVHRLGDKDVLFEPDQESKGTVAYLSLLVPILIALQNGALLCVDELDASLHPLIALQLIRFFNRPASNRRSAQLIFNTHDTNLLSSGDIRRDQIWFTEKDPAGRSNLYPLTDFKPRRQENLENGYLQGRYGAIPFIHPDHLTGSAGGDGEKS
jgi:uncharacterized protein